MRCCRPISAAGRRPSRNREAGKPFVRAEHRVRLVVRRRRLQRRRLVQQPRGGQGVIVRGPHRRQHRDLAAVQQLARGRLDRSGQHGLRTREIEALGMAQPEVAHRAQFLRRFHALGHELRAEGLGDLDQSPYGLDFIAVAFDAAREVLVELDELGLDLGPQPQARPTVTEIVERHADALAPQRLERRAKRGHVAHALVLRQLDHHRLRRNAAGTRHVERTTQVTVADRRDQGVGAQVDEQTPPAARGAPAHQRHAHALELEGRADALGARSLEQQVRRGPATLRRRPHQRLVGVNVAAVDAHNRLEMHVQAAALDELGDATQIRCRGRHEIRFHTTNFSVARPNSRLYFGHSGPHVEPGTRKTALNFHNLGT